MKVNKEVCLWNVSFWDENLNLQSVSMCVCMDFGSKERSKLDVLERYAGSHLPS